MREPESELTDLLKRLVAIDSVNPDLVPGAKGESEVAAFISQWLSDSGVEVYLEDSGRPGRPNVVAIARGTGKGRSLLLNAHMDTVGVAGMTEPFTPVIKNGRLYGRGALDTKSALAAFMTAIVNVKDIPHRGDVILTAVIDEEYASAGTDAVVTRWKADGAIVGEPTGLRIVTEHKGFAWYEIETAGVAAHGSRPDLGVDAIVKMGKVLAAIEQYGQRLSSIKNHPSLGPGSVHASLISGGQEISSYPARCRLSVERRTIPGETVEAVTAQIQGLLDETARDDPDFRATLQIGLARGPMEISRNSSLAVTLAKHVQNVTGNEPVFAGMGGWMDSALLAASGTPAIVFGPSGEGLHAEIEWVDLRSVRVCTDIVIALIEDFCNQPRDS